MKITLLPVANAPDYYAFDGEVVTAFQGGASESYDLSVMPEGAILEFADQVNGIPAIRAATRVEGELHVTLCQQVGPGHWLSSSELDSTNYDPDAVYVVQDTTRAYAGRAWAKTRQGKQFVEVAPNG